MNINLVLLGLDDSGKTSVAMHIMQKQVDGTVPTLGFSSYKIPLSSSQFKNVSVTLLDLGGSSSMRALWPNYYGTAHGFIFLLDSSDPKRLTELKSTFQQVLKHPQVQEKPILLLLNKQDLEWAIEEMEIFQQIDLEKIVNQNRCPTRIEGCSAISGCVKDNEPNKNTKYKMDAGIQRGFSWMVHFVVTHWIRLNARVTFAANEEAEVQNKRIHMLRHKYGNLNKDTSIESNDVDVDMKKSPFRPIKELVQEMAQSKSINKHETAIDAQVEQNNKTNLMLNAIKSNAIQ